jgi:hypothetical protein
MQSRSYKHSSHFDFNTLFIGISKLFYTINLNIVSLLADSSFLLYSTNMNKRICKKKKKRINRYIFNLAKKRLISPTLVF